MTANHRAGGPAERPELRAKSLPKWSPWAVAAAALVVSFILVYLTSWAAARCSPASSRRAVRGCSSGSRRRSDRGRPPAGNRVATTLIWSTFVLALLPLISVAWTLISKGWEKFTPYFCSTR